jgi:hypothetical protein
MVEMAETADLTQRPPPRSYEAKLLLAGRAAEFHGSALEAEHIFLVCEQFLELHRILGSLLTRIPPHTWSGKVSPAAGGDGDEGRFDLRVGKSLFRLTR